MAAANASARGQRAAILASPLSELTGLRGISIHHDLIGEALGRRWLEIVVAVE